MKWLQAFKLAMPKHKYAIDAKALGDMSDLPWSNLGYWNCLDDSYPQACRQLADRIAQSIALSSNDRLLDLGCGQGASILHWKNDYQIEEFSAVDMQPECIERLQTVFPEHRELFCQSFLNLNEIPFQSKFDAVVCIDAAYHSLLNSFLTSVDAVLNSNGRIAFHTLMLTEQFSHLSAQQKFKHRMLLKCADVNVDALPTYAHLVERLQGYCFSQIRVEDLSEPVLSGFASYIIARDQQNVFKGLSGLKIKMTAKLCKVLYEQGNVRYVQVSARKR